MEYLEGSTRTPVREFGPRIPVASCTSCGRWLAGGGARRRLVHRASSLRTSSSPSAEASPMAGGRLRPGQRSEGTASTASRATDITARPYCAGSDHRSEIVDGRSDSRPGRRRLILCWRECMFEGGTLVEVCSHHLRTLPVALRASGAAATSGFESVLLAWLEKDLAAAAVPTAARTTHLVRGRDEASTERGMVGAPSRVRDLRMGGGRATRPPARPCRWNSWARGGAALASSPPDGAHQARLDHGAGGRPDEYETATSRDRPATAEAVGVPEGQRLAPSVPSVSLSRTWKQ